MERVSNLVGRGSRTTQSVSEALGVELRTRHARPQDSPSRDPARHQRTQWVKSQYPAIRPSPTITKAHPHPPARRSFGPTKSSDGHRELTPVEVSGLMGASPHQ